MEYNPFLQKNNKKNKEYLKGKLMVSVNGAIIGIPFNYSQSKVRSYTSQIAGGVPVEYVGVSEQIYTTRIDLPFAHGSKVELHDGSVMTVTSIDNDFNENAALYGNYLKGCFINLDGGGR